MVAFYSITFYGSLAPNRNDWLAGLIGNKPFPGRIKSLNPHLKSERKRLSAIQIKKSRFPFASLKVGEFCPELWLPKWIVPHDYMTNTGKGF